MSAAIEVLESALNRARDRAETAELDERDTIEEGKAAERRLADAEDAVRELEAAIELLTQKPEPVDDPEKISDHGFTGYAGRPCEYRSDGTALTLCARPHEEHIYD